MKNIIKVILIKCRYKKKDDKKFNQYIYGAINNYFSFYFSIFPKQDFIQINDDIEDLFMPL